MGATVAVDLALQLAREKRVFFPLSAVITSFGFQLLVIAPSAWMYAALGAAAMAAKNLVRWRGRHVFNPSNFVVVAVLLLLPSGTMTVAGGWGGSLWGLALAALLGVLAVRRAERLGVVGGYLGGFLLGAVFQCLTLERPLAACLSPLWDPLFPIFAFFMITDPRTTPGGTRDGALFGLAVAGVETLLRLAGAVYAPFYALFALTAVEAALPGLFAPAAPARPSPAA